MAAYDFQLLLKHLLEHGVAWAPDQEIVYADKNRYTYRILNERINRLASGLKKFGVAKGDMLVLFCALSFALSKAV